MKNKKLTNRDLRIINALAFKFKATELKIQFLLDQGVPADNEYIKKLNIELDRISAMSEKLPELPSKPRRFTPAITKRKRYKFKFDYRKPINRDKKKRGNNRRKKPGYDRVNRLRSDGATIGRAYHVPRLNVNYYPPKKKA